MKLILLTLAITFMGSAACMSDKACASLNSCCYMNQCKPLDSLECSHSKMDIFKEIAHAELKDNKEVKSAVKAIRQKYGTQLQGCDE